MPLLRTPAPGSSCAANRRPGRGHGRRQAARTFLGLWSDDLISETSVRAGARKLFEQHLYPIMAPHQQALFVPPAYGCNDTACANTLCCSNSTRDGPNPPCHGDCSLAMLQWAKFSYDWARDDHRIVVRPPHAFESESCSDRDRIAERAGTEPMGECSNGRLGL